MTHPLVEKIVRDLRSDISTNRPGILTFEFANIKLELDNKDILGGVLQSWFAAWLAKNSYKDKQHRTQEFPDFLLNGNIYLELKTFNSEATPAFDVANFGSYVDSLLEVPERLDSDYLILAYKLNDAALSISNIWIKKVWEITGPSNTNIISLQVKRNQPVNIRPKSGFRTNSGVFGSRRDFVEALWHAGQHFSFPSTCGSRWMSQVEYGYKRATGSIL